MSGIRLPSPVTYGEHLQQWKNCEGCDLCVTRTNTVFFRAITIPSTPIGSLHRRATPYPGKYPHCDILGIGEAPGESEDITGQPFTGPAGKLLDVMVRESFKLFAKRFSVSRIPYLGLTNIVSCYPVEDTSTVEPTAQQIEACRERLIQFIVSSRPTWIICFGKIARDNFPGGFNHATKNFPFLHGISHVLHPSAILRIDNPSRKTTEKILYQSELVKIYDQWLSAVVVQESQHRKVKQ